VKRFCVEFSGWPAWEPFQNVTLGDERLLSPGTVGWFGKVVFEIQVGPDAHEEDSFPILRDAEISGVQHGPLNLVTRGPVAAKLILEESSALTECHSIDIFNDKCLRLHFSEDPIEFTIQKIDRVTPTSFPALAVALAWIAAHQ